MAKNTKEVEYDDAFLAPIAAVYRRGGGHKEAALKVGVSDRTYRKWLATHPRLALTVENAYRSLPNAKLYDDEDLRDLSRKWIGHYLETQGAITEKTEVHKDFTDGIGVENTIKVTTGRKPDIAILKEFLGPSTQDNYTVTINVVDPRNAES